MPTMEPQTKKKNGLKMVLFIQAMVFLYSVVSMLSKVASISMQKYGLFSIQFILVFGAIFLGMGIYAILWQQVLKRAPLTTAYVHKATTLLWSMLWSVTLFHETLKWNNVVGAIIVVLGIILVTHDD